MNLLQKWALWLLSQPMEEIPLRAGEAGLDEPDGASDRPEQLTASERRELAALRRRLEALEAQWTDWVLSRVDRPTDRYPLPGNAPVTIQQLTVEHMTVEKLQYELNFDALGINELTGTLNIGTNYGVMPSTEKPLKGGMPGSKNKQPSAPTKGAEAPAEASGKGACEASGKEAGEDRPDRPEEETPKVMHSDWGQAKPFKSWNATRTDGPRYTIRSKQL